MLVFVIPVKSKSASKSWAKVSDLFEKTVRSVCQQKSQNFQAIVVCHEKPDIAFEHPKITYVEVDFPMPSETAGRKESLLDQKRTDKGRKQLRGLVAAQDFKPTHTMLLDADDLVSNKLSEFVENNPQANGWVIKNGYLYTYGSQWIYRKSKNFYKMCGSCNIIRNDLNRIPKQPEYNRGYGYYKLQIDHAKVLSSLAESGNPLETLPFFGAIYVTDTGENIYFDSSRLYKSAARLINYRPLGKQLKKEFGL